MEFLTATYSDVVGWQLFGGWIFAFVAAYFFVWRTLWRGLALKAAKNVEQMEWVKKSQWSAEDYGYIGRLRVHY